MDANGTQDGAAAEAEGEAVALGVALTAVSAVGLLLNTYLLVVIVLTKQPSSASGVLLLHLGAVGALASGAGLGARADGAGCAARGYLLAALHPLQLWTVCGLHADRCAAIAAPLHYAALVSSRKALMCLGCGWVVTLVLLAPLAVSHPPLQYSASLATCTPDCGAGPVALAYCTAYAALTLLLPSALVLLCTLKILRIARYHRHRIAAAIYEVTLSAQVTVTHQRNPFSPPPPPRRRSALASVLQPMCSLVLLYFPYYGVMLCHAAAVPPAPLAIAAVALLTAAPPANVVLYGLRSHAVRSSLRNYWRKRLTKSEVTQEIQARTPSACGSRRPSLSGGSGSMRMPPSRRLSDAAALGVRSVERPAPRAASCNTLRGAVEEAEASAPTPRVTRSSAIPVLRAPPHVLLGRALGLEEVRRASNAGAGGRRRRSPRITVTRAMSDESESPVRAPLCRQQSRSSGALLFGDGGVSPASSEEALRAGGAVGGVACGEDQLLLSWPPAACHHNHAAA